ncbi:unnamed protein product [Prunus armeniaca]|uniref:Uncharacterized protein n=1 Tax=Prunus armeniaca TaxID=36596 RepID=A0A6J5THF9_PRUAR|nr:unnamed protein product [Prunus armeniaca]
MPAGNNGSVMKESGRQTNLTDRKTLLPSRYWSIVPAFPASARAPLSPLHNIREVAPESKCECPLEVPHARFDRERGGQLPPVLAPAAAPRELQYVVDLPPAAAPRYPR